MKLAETGDQIDERQIEDARLATRVQDGEKSALASLYTRYHPMVYGYFRARVLDTHVTEDLAQEVFLRIFGAIGRFDTERRFQSWLMGICRNVLREHVRGIRRRKEIMWTELCLELEEMVDEDSLYDDVLHMVPGCMATLSESASQSLHWHYMGGQKIDQIARRLKRSVGAVKVLMVRARQALKRCIKKQMTAPADGDTNEGGADEGGTIE
ncbi:MAG: sigma-70 family RNA polymerase sigma factor [Phycisphaera sp.]|nr:sigma-70 family RNA polymerase sigma factor [Phycisphaera sp.]